MHQKIGLAVTAHVTEPHPGLSELDAGRNLGHGPGSIQPTFAEVSPVPESGRTAVQHIREAVAEQVHQREIGIVQRLRRHVIAVRGNRLVALFLGPKLRVFERHRGDRGQERNPRLRVVFIGEVGGSHQGGTAEFAEVVNHQNPPAASYRDTEIQTISKLSRL